ncbi:hypothetical protein KDH_43640 [Dictyobacter sp. S3.2.2.5]|uniref:Uncharacterized protein n=1 Tax=Dictyobacter halimunensis TaxID=3026934 RepID=A0ABQ6FW94_9CHLR|nr:hypothetical protein KDH_43640 [Dictyobacter sp. S3.2.2.5]
MHGMRRRFGQPVDQYSHEYHLSRTVQCVECGAELVKDHHFVLRGRRWVGCWSQSPVSECGVVMYTTNQQGW